MAKGRIEANDIVADNYLSKAIQSATVYEGHLQSISSHIQTILAETSKMAGSGNANSSSGINATTTAYNNANSAINSYTKLQAEVARLEEKLVQLMSGERDELIRLQKEVQQLTAAKRAQAQVQQAEIGAYQEAVNKLHQMKRAVLDLLVAEKANTAEAKNLIAEYERLNKVVRKAEEGVGQYHRNVGNYASGQRKYNYEMFQMTQIMRELPNFAMSARIGVMALSNNLPQLGDAFRKIATDTKEGTDQMNGYGFAAKTMLKSVFSWQSLMLVGITIAVAYADAIGKWVSGLFRGNEALKALQSSTELTNYAIKNNGDSFANAHAEILKYTTYVDLAKKGLMDKKTVTDEYNKSLGKSLGIAKDFYDVEKALIEQGPAYIKMSLYKGAADAVAKTASVAIVEQEQNVAYYQGLFNKEADRAAKDKVYRYEYYEAKKELFRARAERDTLINQQTQLYQSLMSRAANWADSANIDMFGGFSNTSNAKTTIGGKTSVKVDEDTTIELKKSSDDWYKIQMQFAANMYKINSDKESIRHNHNINVEGEEKRHNDNMLKLQIDRLRTERNLGIFAHGNTPESEIQEWEIKRLESQLGIAPQINKTTSTNAKTTTPANAMKDTAKAMVQLGQALDQFLDAQEKRRQQQIERQIDATKRRQDDLKLLASIGSKDAKDSLAIEEKRQAELERKQDQIARRNAKRQLGIAALNSYSAKVGRGDVNATASTISDIATLMGFISALPGFYEGTENVEKSLGKPSIKGKDGYVIRVDGKERVLNPTQNMKIGNMSNEDLAELAYSHRTKSVKSNAPLYNDEIINKLDSVEKAIKSQPIYDTAWNEQEQAIQRTITAGNFVQKELFKTGGVWRK